MSLKPLTGLISDVVVPLPAEDVQKSPGLALDIGSTIGKIIYRSNKEYKDGQPLKPQDDTSKGQVHFAMFPRSDIKGMIEYIKDNCDFKTNEGNLSIFSSGVGGAAFQKDIEEGLNCKMEVIAEFDCFCKAFLALEKVLSCDELLLVQSQKAEDAELKAKFEAMMEKANTMQETAFSFGADGQTVKDEDRPRLLVMAGSGTGIMQINHDGTFALVDGLHMAGRFMYGLSSILTGENDFATLEKMAAESDGKTTDIWFSDLKGKKQEGTKENIYDSIGMEDVLLFPFGKGVSVPAADMKKGDLVWSVFNATASIHVQLILANVKLCKAKSVYFCGNTFNSQVMRDLVMKMTVQYDAVLPKNLKFDTHFLKNGGMYGAMGAYLHVNKQEVAEQLEITHL